MKNKATLKSRVSALLCIAILAAAIPQCPASTSEGEAITIDVLLVRPFCLLSTICGSAIFVISLPIAVPSKSVHSAARALVSKPAHATFTRPLGDLDDIGGEY